ncbi:hypothetical protein [Dankookia sp. P2]|uniref:hypothetical protein n=1 Tax=Dankookia sp. P2 TaxID=3423955 RepID=UPI003D665E2E
MAEARQQDIAAAQHRIRNLVPSKDTSRDWTLHDAVRAGAVHHHALPPAVDLRAPWWRVGNQGSTGSCIGWAAGRRRHALPACQGRAARADHAALAALHLDGGEGI